MLNMCVCIVLCRLIVLGGFVVCLPPGGPAACMASPFFTVEGAQRVSSKYCNLVSCYSYCCAETEGMLHHASRYVY